MSMTEQDWLECDDPDILLRFLRGRASERKLRLFACACAWRVWHLITDRWSRKTIKVAEKFADGLVDEAKLKYAWGDARRSCQQVARANRDHVQPGFVAFYHGPADSDAWMAAWHTGVNSASVLANATSSLLHAHDPWRLAYDAERRVQCTLLRDVFGNPFRAIGFDPSWRTAQAVAVAQAMYEDRKFEDLPLLADALEEAGCTDSAILHHCHATGPHARGCWVIDFLLGKS
jgi:hypothetical protein